MKTLFKPFLTLLLLIVITANVHAQVTTNEGSGLDPTYGSLAAAINALNAVTITSPVVITLSGDETAPIGGFAITATGTSTNTIIIQGISSTITAPTPQTSGVLVDAIFKIIGGDYITIRNFTMLENAANTTTAAATNNMTEFGVALFYASTTNGCQNVTIHNNIITLNRTYQNTFGIYSNSTHSSTAIGLGTATTAEGGNHNLTITGNTISNVNNGIVVLGPLAAADHNNGLTIGGSLANANTLTNFGTTGTFSGYNAVSGTNFGILIRNVNNFTVSYNTLTSSNGGITVASSLRGIYIPAFSNAPSGTFTSTISNNTLSLKHAFASSAILGIVNEITTTTNTSTININNNDFNNFGHTVAGSAAITFISNAGVSLHQHINNNTFTKISLNTTGSVTFITNSVTLPAGGSQNANNNSIVTGFSKTGVGGTITFYTTSASSVNGTTVSNVNNNFSNITVTGATAIAGWSNTDGASSTSGPTKTITGNIFSNFTGGTSSITGLSVNYSGANTVVSSNTVNNITNGAAITGINLGSSNQNYTAAQNTVYGLAATAGAVTGITASVAAANTASIPRNKIYDLQSTNATGTVFGIILASGTTLNAFNNLVGDLRAPSTSSTSDAIRGINITSTTTSSNINLSFNTIYINASSAGTNFSTVGVFHTTSTTATTAALNMRNNIIVNTSVPAGTGNTVAFRRSSGVASTLNNYSSSSNNNLFFAGTPSATNLIYSDGTSAAQTIDNYKNGAFTAGTIAPRDAASFTENPSFQ
ncbi:MAG: hypothetical protein Q8Q47_02955, partial [Ignavibacteriaceae bacterium]|nr:hypothetical protein [Ignavibacteriaceae bacterium]